MRMAPHMTWKIKRLRNWVEEIRDLAYVAEDVIEDFIVNEQRKRHRRSKGKFGIFKRILPSISLGKDYWTTWPYNWCEDFTEEAGREIEDFASKTMPKRDKRAKDNGEPESSMDTPENLDLVASMIFLTSSGFESAHA
ncbi:hypothetical protein QJS10_CPB19g00253 [Acorus calamus]|uniref:Disease resistance N-terminal domain-containing protein n=1 Tax=Acorus calamus TaxID=4465 RepID=A0AAV9CGI2_ACOCL|nr:hypothetical protein QJS10_CPB19g00253 [Acorus calamus]